MWRVFCLIIVLINYSVAFADNLADEELIVAQNAGNLVQNKLSDNKLLLKNDLHDLENNLPQISAAPLLNNNYGKDLINHNLNDLHQTVALYELQQEHQIDNSSTSYTPSFNGSSRLSIPNAINTNEYSQLKSLNASNMQPTSSDVHNVEPVLSTSNHSSIDLLTHSKFNEVDLAIDYCKHDGAICVGDYSRHLHKL